MSFIITSLHIILGLPVFLFPVGIQCSACLARLTFSMRCTWPNHLGLLSWSVHFSSDWVVFLLTLSFFTLSYKFSTLLRRLWWKTSRRFLVNVLTSASEMVFKFIELHYVGLNNSSHPSWIAYYNADVRTFNFVSWWVLVKWYLQFYSNDCRPYSEFYTGKF